MKNERTRLYDALTNPKTAADYGVEMPVADFIDEAEARGDSHPWLPPKEGLAKARRLRGTIQTMSRSEPQGLLLRCVTPAKN